MANSLAAQYVGIFEGLLIFSKRLGNVGRMFPATFFSAILAQPPLTSDMLRFYRRKLLRLAEMWIVDTQNVRVGRAVASLR